MNVWRCLICGDSYIGEGQPTHCPFCGAHQKYMVSIESWKDLNEGLILSSESRKNVIEALHIELKNTAFYDAAAMIAKKENDDQSRSIFRALAKVEAEHASTLKKVLEGNYPHFEINEKAYDATQENFEESLRRETFATGFYQQAHDEASETRIKQIFKALVEVEADHVALDKEHLGLS